jgi:peroxiredoxin
MYKKLILVMGIVVLMLSGIVDIAPSVAIGRAQENNNQVEIGLKEGNKAPDFQLSTLDGTEMKLSDLQGKVVFLNFWATWCPPCKEELPHMQKFYQEKGNNEVEILAVNLTTAERNSNGLEKFVKDYGLTFPVLLDNKGEIGKTYQAYTIPTSYLIDKEGIIRKKLIGPMDVKMMNDLVNHLEQTSSNQ